MGLPSATFQIDIRVETQSKFAKYNLAWTKLSSFQFSRKPSSTWYGKLSTQTWIESCSNNLCTSEAIHILKHLQNGGLKLANILYWMNNMICCTCNNKDHQYISFCTGADQESHMLNPSTLPLPPLSAAHTQLHLETVIGVTIHIMYLHSFQKYIHPSFQI